MFLLLFKNHFLSFSKNFLTFPFSLGLGVWTVGGLEVSTGKVSSIEAMNGSTVLLPCTYSSCIGIENLYFNWQYNDNGTLIKVRAHNHNTNRDTKKHKNSDS